VTFEFFLLLPVFICLLVQLLKSYEQIMLIILNRIFTRPKARIRISVSDRRPI